jgi:hypothetical protein
MGDVGSGVGAQVILNVFVFVIAIGFGLYGYSKFKERKQR